MPSHEAHRFSLNSNSAGGPLPLIPRRMAPSPSTSRPPLSTSHSLPTCLHTLNNSSSTSTVTLSSTSTSVSNGLSAESSRNDSDSSSSSSGMSDESRPTIRPKRVRGVRRVSPTRHSESSAPAPTTGFARVSTITETRSFTRVEDTNQRPASSRPFLYSPGMSLRLCKDSLKARNASESHVSLGEGPKSAPCEPTVDETKVIRKKSGQLVKPSLKTSRSASRTNLCILTASISSKSEPATPTSKAVHFDTKLEHVKLFLAEQKPLAVSRDGSPTDDTSGTDSDFPKFIYGDGPAPAKRRLAMQVANMPAAVNPYSDVALEELSLTADGTSIVGRVRVRNLAYSKWVAVRFTLDSWQTTSEVVGRYVESLGPDFDRFVFTIRLNDLLARIELKTLILAIRYSIEGKEMWDNNNGQNYYATFTKGKVEDRGRSTFSDDEGSDIADLQSKLEKVVESKNRTGPAFNNPQFTARRHSSSSSADSDIASFRSTASFASRYDLSTSLKSPWRPVTSPPLHTRTQSFPLSASKGSLVPWPSTGPSELYIPKRNTAASQANPILSRSPREAEDVPPPSFHRAGVRNHQRGYFDIPTAPPTLKRTPPGSPAFVDSPISDEPSPPVRCNSFPPVDGNRRSSGFESIPVRPGMLSGIESSSSALSTPSMATPSSTSSFDSTPSPPEPFPASGLPVEHNYRQFIDKFCFFTGSQAPAGAESHRSTSTSTGSGSSVLPPSSSSSSSSSSTSTTTTSSSTGATSVELEDFLSGLSPPLDTGIPAHVFTPSSGFSVPLSATTITTPSTSTSSLDDAMVSRSGSITPTVSQMSVWRSSQTPPAVVVATPVLS